MRSAGEAVLATGNFEAYGQTLGGTGSYPTPYTYGATSHYRSEGDAGLFHIGARWYDPVIGRWLSADTDLGEQDVPLSRNRYTYCEDEPINWTDPTGHSPISDWWDSLPDWGQFSVIGVGVGGAAGVIFWGIPGAIGGGVVGGAVFGGGYWFFSEKLPAWTRRIIPVN